MAARIATAHPAGTPPAVGPIGHAPPTRRRATLVAATLVLLLAGCSSDHGSSYVERYQAALDAFPGVSPIDSSRLDAFVNLFEHLGDDDWEQNIRALYAPEHHFSDTLACTSRLDPLVDHFRMMRKNGAPRLAVMERIIDGADAYLLWRMSFEFKPMLRTVTSTTIGMTHLRFDEDGRVVLHQDFWDSATGFYQHLPVLGPAVRTINRRFDVEE